MFGQNGVTFDLDDSLSGTPIYVDVVSKLNGEFMVTDGKDLNHINRTGCAFPGSQSVAICRLIHIC